MKRMRRRGKARRQEMTARSPQLVVVASFYRRFNQLTIRFQRPGEDGCLVDAPFRERHIAKRRPSSTKREVRDEAK